MIGSYYIYLNDETFSLTKETIYKNKLLKEAMLKQWVFPLFIHKYLLKENIFLQPDVKFAIFFINLNNTYKKSWWREKKVVVSSRSFFLNTNKNLCSILRCAIYYKKHATSTYFNILNKQSLITKIRHVSKTYVNTSSNIFNKLSTKHLDTFKVFLKNLFLEDF